MMIFCIAVINSNDGLQYYYSFVDNGLRSTDCSKWYNKAFDMNELTYTLYDLPQCPCVKNQITSGTFITFTSARKSNSDFKKHLPKFPNEDNCYTSYPLSKVKYSGKKIKVAQVNIHIYK